MFKKCIYRMIMALIVAFLMASCSSLPESQRISGDARINMRSANIYWNQQDFHRALELYKQVVAEYPENIEALKRISDIYFYLGENEPQKEAEHYQSSMNYNHKILEAYESLSESTRAIDEIVVDARLKIRAAWARLFQRGQDIFGAGDFDSSLELFYDLAEATPDSTNIYIMIASIHQQKEDPDKAAEYFTRIAEIDETDTVSRRNLASYYFAQENYEQALKWFDSLSELEPEIADYYFNIGIIHNLLNNHDQAIENFIETYRLDPEFTEAAFSAAGIAYNELNDYERSQDIYKMILDHDESNIDALMFLCYSLNMSSKYEELLEYAKLWYELDKTSEEAVQFVLVAANRLNKTDVIHKYLTILDELTD